VAHLPTFTRYCSLVIRSITDSSLIAATLGHDYQKLVSLPASMRVRRTFHGHGRMPSRKEKVQIGEAYRAAILILAHHHQPGSAASEMIGAVPGFLLTTTIFESSRRQLVR